MNAFRVGLKTLAAAALIAVGTALLVLPGPGIPFIIAGVFVLAGEFAWAASMQERAVALWRQIVRRGASV
ncbi:MAG TPA: PGPGW domain-containing protein [Polyangiaceae bacterium]|nr:PGPGW domain-containing protein [Polyangiaceae bacterium]